MSGLETGLLVLAVLMGLLALRVHVGIGMFLAGILCYVLVNHGNLNALLFTINNLVYARVSDYDLAVIPLFVLMGQFAIHGGLSRALFRAASAFIGHWRGGLAMSAAGACAGFGAICGSSLATAATMSQVALPELEKHHYPKKLAAGTIAAGGTLGILIPPSVPLIVYAVLTQESIGKLFVAAIIPGLLAMLGYLIVIRLVAMRTMRGAPRIAKAAWGTRLRALAEVSPVLLVFLVVIFGIYGGWANLTEAASIGAGACGLFAVTRGGMRGDGLVKSLIGTAEASAMIYLVVIGADLLNSGLALSRMPVELADWVQASGMAPFAVLLSILVIYLLLGCVMDSLSMILLTVPIFYPIVVGLPFFDLTQTEISIWFGIIALMVVEIGLITPPMGMNLFIVQKFSERTSLGAVSRGIVPFLGADLVRITLLVAVPALSLLLLSVA
ncbi:MAG: C4-dicarboxylate ABC transporter permease [Alcanivorax sp.]|nr:C4-dicarboxylate ABC transporter permease [Alcanivorax sp.]UWN48734.1 C4-dicarboxylate TRAP transporter large permease protein DctM [Alcanivorax sp. ALC70]MAY09789.1 C4-dicarboxylate ABC transporter permease [Alcanivorax sp.]MBI53225.1 C4-dicarboxylate ABC transporter permease [Alcanivorax sp.]MBU57486.1 C4-dicarboxylate ABC transporter permease [Alcanivorax sp.]|tara:strand:- start:26313 stop:27638 length:1326 start_codon:yes stop_codon:yes gene_type:complete